MRDLCSLKHGKHLGQYMNERVVNFGVLVVLVLDARAKVIRSATSTESKAIVSSALSVDDQVSPVAKRCAIVQADL